MKNAQGDGEAERFKLGATTKNTPCLSVSLFAFSYLAAQAGCSACESGTTGGTDAATALPSASHPPAPPVGLGPRSAALPCRAIAVDGDVEQEAEDARVALAERSQIPREGWLSLSAGARLVVKDPRTSRETTFRGPGRARACVDLDEESWLAGGTFESALGTGETPGAEEWVVTHLGVIRFGAAKLTVDVGSREVRVRVASGPAFVWAADDAAAHSSDGGLVKSMEADEGWVRIAEGAVTLTPAAFAPQLSAARSAVQACMALANASHELAAALLETDASPMTAMRQVATRRRARAGCGVAALRREVLSPSEAPPEATAGLSASLKDAAALWRSLPLR
jgi:hypothetical protein